MSSRAEEKERRRNERLAAEQAAQRGAAARKRIGIVVGAVLAVAVVAVVLLAVFTGGDDGPSTNVAAQVPAQKITKLADAATAAGCAVNTYPSEGRGHTTQPEKYKTNPPTSGPHDPTPSQDGIYDADNPPDLEQSVHALEHGRIEIQYKKGTPEARINQLETIFNEDVKGKAGYHTLLFENQTNMDAVVAATAWRHSLTCPAWNDRVFDAIRTFRTQYVDKGPEFIP